LLEQNAPLKMQHVFNKLHNKIIVPRLNLKLYCIVMSSAVHDTMLPNDGKYFEPLRSLMKKSTSKNSSTQCWTIFYNVNEISEIALCNGLDKVKWRRSYAVQ